MFQEGLQWLTMEHGWPGQPRLVVGGDGGTAISDLDSE